MEDQFVSKKVYEEKKAPSINGFAMLFVTILVIVACIAAIIGGGVLLNDELMLPGGVLWPQALSSCACPASSFPALRSSALTRL